MTLADQAAIAGHDGQVTERTAGAAEAADVHRGVQGADPGRVRRAARRQPGAGCADAPRAAVSLAYRALAASAGSGHLAGDVGEAAKSAEGEELARLRAENKKLKARNDKLQSELGKTKTALDIAGKAFALLENISGSADSGEN